jgi:predicted PurR-regulated permease PerM
MTDTLKEMTKRNRKIAVIVNYLSVLAIGLVIKVGEWAGFNIGVIITAAIIATVIAAVTFYLIYWRTQLWRLVHTRFGRLDEREVQLVYEALRYSYTIFIVACLIIIYINVIAEQGYFSALVPTGLLYLSHALPASIVAWTEKEVLISN